MATDCTDSTDQIRGQNVPNSNGLLVEDRDRRHLQHVLLQQKLLGLLHMDDRENVLGNRRVAKGEAQLLSDREGTQRMQIGQHQPVQVLIGITSASACIGAIFGQTPYVLAGCCCLMAAGVLRTGLLHACGHDRAGLVRCAAAAFACLVLAAGTHPIYSSLSRGVQDIWDWATVAAWLAVGALLLMSGLQQRAGARQRVAHLIHSERQEG